MDRETKDHIENIKKNNIGGKLSDKNKGEISDEITNHLYQQVLGVSSKTKAMIDTSNDVNINDYNTLFARNKNEYGSFLDMRGRTADGTQTSVAIKERLEHAGKNIPIVSDDFQEKVAQQMDNLYIISEMPQLYLSFEMEVNEIISPNKVDADKWNFTVEGDMISKDEINEIRKRKGLDNLSKDSMLNTLIGGYKFIHVVPYEIVGNRLLDNYGIEKPKTLKMDKYDVRLSGENTDDKEEYLDMKLLGEKCDELLTEIDDENRVTLVGESILNTLSPDMRNATGTKITESPLTESAKDSINRNLLLYGEAYKIERESSSKIRKLTGCHIEALDNTKVIPVLINRELIGVYYIERAMDTNIGQNRYNDILGNSSVRGNSMSTMNPIMRKMLLDEITGAVKESLNKKFIKDNKHIIGTLERLLDEKALLDGHDIIRFIPREFLVPFQVNVDSSGLGRSQLKWARVPAHYWILLNQNDMLNELYHKKDKVLVKYKQSVSTDIQNSVQDVIDQVLDTIPNPANILNLADTHISMGDISTFITPMTKGNESAIEFDKIDGQETERDSELKNKLENVATFLAGIPVSLTDISSDVDFAAQMASTNIRVAVKVAARQTNFNESNSELFSKICSYEKGENIKIRAEFNPPAILAQTANNDAMSAMEDKIEKLITIFAGTDEKKASWLRAELWRELGHSLIDVAKMDKILDKWKMVASKESENENGEEY